MISLEEAVRVALNSQYTRLDRALASLFLKRLWKLDYFRLIGTERYGVAAARMAMLATRLSMFQVIDWVPRLSMLPLLS
jgi:hypothetical protein